MPPPSALQPRPAWLDWPETVALAFAFAAAGEEMRFVGGCVRDAALGRDARDVDVATPLTPEGVMALLEGAGLRAIPTGLKHGTVTARIADRSFEITTLRRDVSTDGRHAEVAFTSDWKADAARRDFTMNALYLTSDGALYDYHGGVADAKAGRVRFIGAAEARVREDYLRILRFFRFLATQGAPPADADALAACAALRSHLDGLSGERIQQEMLKLLGAPDPLYALRNMEETGVLGAVIGASALMVGEALPAALALERACGLAPHPLARLALLLRGGRENAADLARAVAERWKLSNAMAEELALYVTYPPTLEREEKEWKRHLRRLGEAAYTRLLLRDAAEARLAPGEPRLAAALALARVWRAPVFPLTGGDLLGLGMTPGPQVGKLLAAMEAFWEERDYAPDKARLLAEAEKKRRSLL